jgi:MFS family permease
MYLTDRFRLVSDDERAERSDHARRSRVAAPVVLLGAVSLFTDISSESVSAILALYLTTVVGLGPLAYGFVDGMYQGVSAVCRLAGGWLADRTDRPRRVALAGYALSAATRLLLIPVHTVAAITALLGVDRLGKGIRTAPRDAMIAASTRPGALGRAFGVHRALDTAGAVIGPIVAFLILDALPGEYRAVFVVSFAAAVIGLAILWLLVPDVRLRRVTGDGGHPAPEPAETMSVRTMLRRPDARRLLVVIAVLGLLTVGDGFIYLALQRRDDLAIKYFPLLYVGTNLAYMLLAYPLGRLADRIGRMPVFLAGHVALLTAYLAAGGGIHAAAMTIGCLVLLGGYYAATDGQLAALASRFADAPARATAIGAAQTVQAAARFGSSVLFGAMWSVAGQRSALLLTAGFLAGAIVGTAWFWCRDDSRREVAA